MRSDTPRTHPPAMTPMYIHPAGVKQRLTLFETMADVKKNKTTCLGACTEQCQKDFYALLGEFHFIQYSFGRARQYDLRYRISTYDVVG